MKSPIRTVVNNVVIPSNRFRSCLCLLLALGMFGLTAVANAATTNAGSTVYACANQMDPCPVREVIVGTMVTLEGSHTPFKLRRTRHSGDSNDVYNWAITGGGTTASINLVNSPNPRDDGADDAKRRGSDFKVIDTPGQTRATFTAPLMPVTLTFEFTVRGTPTTHTIKNPIPTTDSVELRVIIGPPMPQPT